MIFQIWGMTSRTHYVLMLYVYIRKVNRGYMYIYVKCDLRLYVYYKILSDGIGCHWDCVSHICTTLTVLYTLIYKT